MCGFLPVLRQRMEGGADRLELCAHLAIGGCTPSPFVFRQVMEDCDHIKANILIRPVLATSSIQRRKWN